MERVAFLLENTGERIACLLNPASLVMRRVAGVRRRSSGSGPLTGAALGDDPLLYTGGGTTELFLDLLFDVSLVPGQPTVENVRDLTRPFAALAESRGEVKGSPVPLVRFVWGKAWNVLGVVASLAERLENFTSAGVPQRSWLRMRMLRVAEDDAAAVDLAIPTDVRRLEDLPQAKDLPLSEAGFHRTQGSGDSLEDGLAERLDEIASRHCGDPGWWRVIAEYNNIDDPWQVPAGQVLRIPPAPVGGTA